MDNSPGRLRIEEKPAPNLNIDTNIVAPSNSRETVKMNLEYLDYLQALS